MIGKIKKGKSFGGCIRYVMGKDDANIIASNGVLLGTNKEMIDSFNCQCLLNPKIKQPLGHIALPFHPHQFEKHLALDCRDGRELAVKDGDLIFRRIVHIGHGNLYLCKL